MVAINAISLPPTAAPEAPQLQTPVATTAPVVPQDTNSDNNSSVNITLSDDAKQSSTNSQKDSPTQAKSKSDPYFEQLAKRQAEAKEEAQKQAQQQAKRTADELKNTAEYLAHIAYAKTIAEQPVNSHPFPQQPQDILNKLNLIS